MGTCSSSCSPNGPKWFPAMLLNVGSVSSKLVILNDDTDVDPGCVEIIPRKRVTPHVRTWLSAQTETRNFSESFTLVTGDLKRQPAFWNAKNTKPKNNVNCCRRKRRKRRKVSKKASLFALTEKLWIDSRKFLTCSRDRLIQVAPFMLRTSYCCTYTSR